MRRKITVLACLTALAFAGAGTALAGGPRHRGPQYRPPAVGHGPHHRAPWNTGYRGGNRGPKGPYCPPPAPVCRPKVGVVAYPPYAQPVYPAYPQVGFGIAARNFSFWLQQ